MANGYMELLEMSFFSFFIKKYGCGTNMGHSEMLG
jgi:hypothetical protein